MQLFSYWNAYVAPSSDPVWVVNYFETNWLIVFRNRFLPFSSIYKYFYHGIDTVKLTVYFENPDDCIGFVSFFVNVFCCEGNLLKLQYTSDPFDLYCPPIKRKWEKGICKTCDQCWPSEAAMRRQRRAHEKNIYDESDDQKVEKQIERVRKAKLEIRHILVIANILDLLKSPCVAL